MSDWKQKLLDLGNGYSVTRSGKVSENQFQANIQKMTKYACVVQQILRVDSKCKVLAVSEELREAVSRPCTRWILVFAYMRTPEPPAHHSNLILWDHETCTVKHFGPYGRLFDLKNSNWLDSYIYTFSASTLFSGTPGIMVRTMGFERKNASSKDSARCTVFCLQK